MERCLLDLKPGSIYIFWIITAFAITFASRASLFNDAYKSSSQESIFKILEGVFSSENHKPYTYRVHMTDNMILSIITIAYNAKNDGLEKTITSVVDEVSKHENIEYIVIDGGSNDGSLGIYEKYAQHFDSFVSEKDSGISDAFNKGTIRARGKYLWFLNAGDYLAPNILDDILPTLESNIEGIIYGDMYWVDEAGNEKLLIAKKQYEGKIEYVMPFMHPATLISREVFKKIGFFDLRLKRAMDYDLVLRAYKAGYRAMKVNYSMAYMTAGGVHDIAYHKTLFEVFKISVFSGGGVIKALIAAFYTYLCQKSIFFKKLRRLPSSK